MPADYAFILSVVTFVLVGLGIYYYREVYKRRALTNQLAGNTIIPGKTYEYVKFPEKYTNYEVKGNVKNYEWRLQEIFNRENDMYAANKNQDYVKFSADIKRNPNTLFIQKKTELVTKPELFEHIQNVFFDGKILNPEVDAQVKEMNIVPYGNTGDFIKSFYVFAKNKNSVKKVLTELTEDVMTHDFHWCKEKAFKVVILKDKLIIKTNTSVNPDDIKSIIRLGEKLLENL